MKLPLHCRELTFVVDGEASFYLLGDPGTSDERTALGWRRKYAPDAKIELKWVKRET